MHVLSRRSFAGPAALRSQKLCVLLGRNRTIASSMAYELFGPSSLLELYFEPSETEALVRSFGRLVRPSTLRGAAM